MRLLGPEHTVESVARQLADGLESGSVVLTRGEGEGTSTITIDKGDLLNELLREAYALRARGRYEESFHYYLRALQLDPANEEARIGGAVALSRMDEPNNYQEAIRQLQVVIIGSPSSARAYYNLASIKVRAGTYPKTEIVRDLRAALELNPGDVVAEADPTFALLRGDPEFARGLCEPSERAAKN